jgi:hypothetical protein
MSVVLPAPERPTMPTFSPEIFLKIDGRLRQFVYHNGIGYFQS